MGGAQRLAFACDPRLDGGGIGSADPSAAVLVQVLVARVLVQRDRPVPEWPRRCISSTPVRSAIFSSVRFPGSL